jgi:hypothetical protein
MKSNRRPGSEIENRKHPTETKLSLTPCAEIPTELHSPRSDAATNRSAFLPAAVLLGVAIFRPRTVSVRSAINTCVIAAVAVSGISWLVQVWWDLSSERSLRTVAKTRGARCFAPLGRTEIWWLKITERTRSNSPKCLLLCGGTGGRWRRLRRGGRSSALCSTSSG